MLTVALSSTVSELYAILVFLYETGSDVAPISPPGGITSQIKWQIMIGRQLPTSYLWLMLTFALSRTVSELYAIMVILFVKLEVT